MGCSSCGQRYRRSTAAYQRNMRMSTRLRRAAGTPKVTVQPQQEQPIAAPKPDNGAEDPSTGHLINVIKNGSSGEAQVPREDSPVTVEHCNEE